DDKKHAFDRAQKRPGLGSDPLSVREVTRVLVDDPKRALGARTKGLHDLADVAHPGCERLRAVRPERIVGKSMPVILEVRPAAGRIDHDLRIVPGESVDVVAGELPRPFAIAG